jgi:hypothetical protein
MAASKSTKKSKPSGDSGDSAVVVLAEKLGWLLGTVQKQADQLPSREELTKRLEQLRDGASDLLDQVNRAREATLKRVTKPGKKATGVKGRMKRGRG